MRGAEKILIGKALRWLTVVTLLLNGSGARGQSWTQTQAPQIGWISVASSADGTHLAAAFPLTLGAGSGVGLSTNSGSTWSLRDLTGSWEAISCSADGTKIALGGSTNLLISDDSGVSWQPQTNVVFTYTITSVASSADGSTLLVGSDALSAVFGTVFYSTNGGSNWTTNGLPNFGWSAVGCSGDATVMAAASPGSPIYISTNSGGVWATNHSPVANWKALAVSSDGSTVAAAAYGTSVQNRD
jgi:hypothetical protein